MYGVNADVHKGGVGKFGAERLKDLTCAVFVISGRVLTEFKRSAAYLTKTMEVFFYRFKCGVKGATRFWPLCYNVSTLTFYVTPYMFDME